MIPHLLGAHRVERLRINLEGWVAGVAGASELRERLEAYADPGRWTAEDGSLWWEKNSPKLAAEPEVVEPSELTLTRNRSE